MRIDRFTQKGQEAVHKAQHLAQEYNHPAIEPEHLLKALIEQEGGVIPSVLNRIGANQDLLAQDIEQALARMSRVSGVSVEVGMSRIPSRDSTCLTTNDKAVCR
jgi:ATP-dependent Clp protease ATP-binding subunit ClpB